MSTHSVEDIKHDSAPPARHAAGVARRPGHRRARRRRPDADQVPRQLPAGRPRHPRGAPPAEARAGLQLHDPHAHAGRRGARRRSGSSSTRIATTLRRARPAHHHAPGLPVPRRDQDRTEADDAGDQRRADRHARRLRRRQPQRRGRAPTRCSRARMRAVHAQAAALSEHLLPQHPRLLRDLARRGTRRRQRQRGRADLRRRPTCRASSRSASRCRRSTTSTCSRRTWASSPSSRDGELAGYNVTVGGGMGATHGDAGDLPAPGAT